MKDLILIIFTSFASFLNLIATIAFIRARDIYTMAHVAMIFNCFVVPICLIAIEIKKFSTLSISKILIIGILNIVIANIICFLIIQRATINKIQPDAELIE